MNRQKSKTAATGFSAGSSGSFRCRGIDTPCYCPAHKIPDTPTRPETRDRRSVSTVSTKLGPTTSQRDAIHAHRRSERSVNAGDVPGQALGGESRFRLRASEFTHTGAQVRIAEQRQQICRKRIDITLR